MKYLFLILFILYLIGAFGSALCGLIGMIIMSEFGRDDEDFIEAKIWFTHCLVFPYAIYKIIKMRLGD